MTCDEGQERVYGWANWTAGMDTPDTVYYQSFNDYGLGWKIHVLNEGEEPSAAYSVFVRTWGLFLTLLLCTGVSVCHALVSSQ